MAAKRLPAHKRKKQILYSAIEVFARGGFHGTTTKDIAAEAEVAEALLYRYFESKEALFVEAIRFSAQQLITALKEIVAKHPDTPIEAVGETLMFFRRVVERQDAYAKMIFVITAELDNAQFREAYLPFQEEALSTIESAMAQWKKRGLIDRQTPSRASAWVILGCFQTIALMKQTRRLEELQLEPIVHMVRSFIKPPTEHVTA